MLIGQDAPEHLFQFLLREFQRLSDRFLSVCITTRDGDARIEMHGDIAAHTSSMSCGGSSASQASQALGDICRTT